MPGMAPNNPPRTTRGQSNARGEKAQWESVTEDDDREERGGKFLEKWNSLPRGGIPVFATTPGRIKLYCTRTRVLYPTVE